MSEHSPLTPARALSVLVVDDNRDAADSMAMLLRLWGFRVRVAYDGMAAFQAVCDEVTGCVIVDINMPGMDGFTLAERVREMRLENATLVMVSAYSDEAHVRRAAQVGFDHRLTKPADLDELRRILDMLDVIAELAKKTEGLAEQNVSLVGETKGLLSEVKEELREVKEELKEVSEIKDELREVKEELREVREQMKGERSEM